MGNFHFPTLPATIDDVRGRITGSVAEVMSDKPHRTWEEICYM
jgi:hypothetical protein